MKRKIPRFFPFGILAVAAILAASSFSVLAAGNPAGSPAGPANAQFADLSGFHRAVEDLIIVVSGSFPGHVHFTGKVVSIDGSIWTIGSRKVTVDARTHVIDSPGVGDMVLVNAATQTDGSLLAIAIKKITSDPISIIHFTGKIMAINGSVWTVGNKSVITDANTKITGSPLVGDTVKVTATLQTDGSFLASEIVKVVKMVTFTGQVISISGPDWTVGDKKVVTDSNTRVDGSPVVGDMVKVSGSLQTDGSYLASSIAKIVKRVDFVGKVISMNGSAWVVGDKKVNTDSNTKITGSPVVGDMVWVAAVLQADGSYLASAIRKITNNDQDFVHFSGKVVSIAGSLWTVDDRKVMTDANTRISGSPAVGDLVKVVATTQADGSLLAVSITKASSDDDDRGENLDFTGKLTAINAGVWSVGQHMVTVDANTKISGSPVVGDIIHVVASRQQDGTLLALTIDLAMKHCETGDDDRFCQHATPTPRPTPSMTATPTTPGTLPPGSTPTVTSTPNPYPAPGSGPTPTPGSNNSGGGHRHHRP